MENLAREIIANHFDAQIKVINQFPTGLSLFVFNVVTEKEQRYVIRIATPERNAELESGLYWQERLTPLQIPLPRIYGSGILNNHCYAIYERLPGNDLETVYHILSAAQKQNIAIQIANIQQKTHLLDSSHFPDIFPWPDILHLIVNRSERELLAKGESSNKYIAQTRHLIEEYQPYFKQITPAAFLYDLNVRNVIIDQGSITGIIDVDSIWFGDPLLAIGRGKTILMTMRENTDFITYWCDYLDLLEQQLQMVDFYALLYTIRFMSTLGQTLNGNYSLQTDPKIAGLLTEIADELLTYFGQ